MSRFIDHAQRNIGRYVVLATPLLASLGALLGALAADAGGANTPAGKAVGGAAAAVATALSISKWLGGLSLWETTQAPAEAAALEAADDAELAAAHDAQRSRIAEPLERVDDAVAEMDEQLGAPAAETSERAQGEA